MRRCAQRYQLLDSAECILNTFPYAGTLTSDDNCQAFGNQCLRLATRPLAGEGQEQQIPSMTLGENGSNQQSPGLGFTRWMPAVWSVLFLLIAVAYAYYTSFSYFAFYDDEGFMMITVQGFLGGHPLYNDVLTGYGPFYYFYEWFIHAVLSVPLTHDFTRVVCIFHWVAAASVLAVAGGLMTRSLWVGLFVFMQATLHLTPLAREPGHPQELVALVLAVAVLVAIGGSQRRSMLVILGAIGAALVFTKINVGVFFGIALLSALIAQGPVSRPHQAFFWGLLAISSLALLLLFRAHLSETWARVYYGQAFIAILTTNVMARVFWGGRQPGIIQVIPVAAAFTGVSILFVSVLLLTGTSLPAMVESLVTAPSKLGDLFSIPLRVPNASWSGIAALLSGLAVVSLRNQLSRFQPVLAVAKGLYGLLGTLLLVGYYNQELGYLWPWGWLVLVGIETESPAARRSAFARLCLGLQAGWQGLQAYPSAGTQAVVGTLLQVLVYSICLHDAIKAAAPWVVRRLPTPTPRTAALLNTVLLAGLLYLFADRWCNPISARRYYRSVPPLGLRGCEQLRLPAEDVETYRTLTQFLQTECDTFITVPGMNSLHFWTGKMPPTYLNSSEIVLLNRNQQTQLIAALGKAKRPLIVVREAGGIYSFTPDTGPLGKLISQQSREIRRIGRFRILEPQPPIAP